MITLSHDKTAYHTLIVKLYTYFKLHSECKITPFAKLCHECKKNILTDVDKLSSKRYFCVHWESTNAFTFETWEYEGEDDKADVTPNAENESKIIFGFSLTCNLMLNIGTQNIIQIWLGNLLWCVYVYLA